MIVIPPRRSALSAGPTDGPWAQREASLQRIRKVGRREWQKESGYRQQARVENSFFRYKSVFGGDLKARHSKAQRREAAIGCHILKTGWPSSLGHRRTLLVGDGPVSRVRCGPVPIHAPTPRTSSKKQVVGATSLWTNQPDQNRTTEGKSSAGRLARRSGSATPRPRTCYHPTAQSGNRLSTSQPQFGISGKGKSWPLCPTTFRSRLSHSLSST